MTSPIRRALTREDLDPRGCDNPTCTHDHSTLYVNPTCHPGAVVEAEYVKATGTLELRCPACRRPICSIQVAHRVAH